MKDHIMYKIYMNAFSEGGHGDNSVETEAVFTEAQAVALSELLRFVVDNANKNYWTTLVIAEGK